MELSMNDRISNIWNELENEPDLVAGVTNKRKYRRLDLENENGLRLSCYYPGKLFELLVEIEKDAEKILGSFPKWKGMVFDLIQLDTPVSGTWHICLRLENREHADVFLNICSDLAEDLQDISSPSDRKEALLDFIERWSSFFERYSLQGLSEEKQRGLFGELWLIHKLINSGINNKTVINSWKGCEGAYHDFDISGKIIEVKTTLSKEPRKVQISNERQLDNRGFISLHLLVFTLIQAQMGGNSLPEIVELIRQLLIKDTPSLRKFEHSLHSAGYIEAHSHLYSTSYTVKQEELFNIVEGFPRIIAMPSGLGDLKYSLLVGACASYLSNIQSYIDSLKVN